MGRKCRTVRKYQGGLPASSCPTTTLCIVRRVRRDISHMNDIEVSYINPQLHSWWTKQGAIFTWSEICLSINSHLITELTCMLPPNKFFAVCKIGTVHLLIKTVWTLLNFFIRTNSYFVWFYVHTITKLPYYCINSQLIEGCVFIFNVFSDTWLQPTGICH